MALLYPNLSAAIADQTPPEWRGTAIVIYRFWYDMGYGIGALGLGIPAHYTVSVDAAFWFMAITMFLSGCLLYCVKSTSACHGLTAWHHLKFCFQPLEMRDTITTARLESRLNNNASYKDE